MKMKNPVLFSNQFFMRSMMLLLGALFVGGLVHSAAQSSSSGQAPSSKVQFDASKFHPTLKPGVPYAFNLCTGREVSFPAKGLLSASKGMKLDTAQGQCGNLSSTGANSAVTGGNPPYHFQLDTMGGFPPIGMHLGMNGLLYGTPSARAPLGGYPPFSVCAVDLSGSSDCQKVDVEPPSPAQNAAHPSHTGEKLLLGGLVVAGVAVAAVTVAGTSSSSSSTLTGGQCAWISPNACSACTSDAQCGSGGVCFLYSSDGGQKAPGC